MNIHILLHDAHRWKHSGKAWIRGKAFEGDRQLTEDTILQHIQKHDTTEQACEYCSRLDGLFGWIHQTQDGIRLSADHHRSVPLFYAIEEEEVYVSDLPDLIWQKQSRPLLDRKIAAEYLVLGYVTGRDTLAAGIRQVEAGSVVEIKAASGDNKPVATVHHYFDYIHHFRSASREQFMQELDRIFMQSMERTATYAGGRPVILPLSGGYDSRLIALALSRLDYPQVTCYTYGRPGSPEMKVSRDLAEALGFGWMAIDYTEEKWRNWFNSTERTDFYRKGARLAGIPNIQELVAIGEMKQKGMIPSEAVIVTGHFGDVLAGGRGLYDSYTYREHPETSEETILRHILHYNYYLWNWSDYRRDLEPYFHDRIFRTLMPVADYPDSPSACESWNIQQRQARFVIHITRLYEHFDLDWWMPFCDLEYLKFWHTVPLKYRHDKNLYTDYIRKQSPIDIPIYKPESRYLTIAEKIRKTPLYTPAQNLFRNWVRYRKRKKEYHSHPFAWYGIMDKTDFDQLFTGRENINSFQSLELLRTLFENGYLTVDEVLKRSCEEIRSYS